MRHSTRAGVRRLALVALVALASQALLPFVHALGGNCAGQEHACAIARAGASAPSSDAGAGSGSSHPADCAVCGALAHGGARTLDAPVVVSVAPARVAVAKLDTAPVPFAASVAIDTACARAPPASLSLA